MSVTPKRPPRILTPEEGVEYRWQFGKETELELRADVDGEASRVFWYVDGNLIGETPPGRSLFWEATTGNRTIRVLDSFGASDAVRISVTPQEN